MVDTSIIERKIYSNVMDTCFNAIVVEAFVNGVPIEESEKTDELRDKLSHYAAECLTDLGSSHLLTEALESVKNHTSRLSAPEVAYLKQINSICMETAKSVTARIIEENKGNDDALKEAADKVALTQSEFERFSKAASSVTPDALSKMIQDKTLNTIKEEKEAFQKDAELELEVVNAINAVSEEENPDELPPEMGDVGEPPKKGAEIGQNAAPGNEEPQSEEPAGESYEYASESIKKLINKASFKVNSARYGGAPQYVAVERIRDAKKNGIVPLTMDEAKKVESYLISNPYSESAIACHIGMHEIVTLDRCPVWHIKRDNQFMPMLKTKSYDIIFDYTGAGVSGPFPDIDELDSSNGSDANESYGFSTRKAMESYVGVQKKVSEDAMDSFMKSIAGQNYRRKHVSIFSKLQELAYEGILATTESYDSIPFDTMAAITKENTFSKFTSHRTKDLKATMESVSRYNFESMGTPDAPTKEQLSTGLLVASIIYAFFETLNSMNLYCPKLNEIREFVDEAIPIKDRVALDRKQFMDFFRSVIANAQHQLRGVNTVPDVEVIQKDLDVVREHTASPGFDDDRPEINEAIESLQNAIDAKRDLIIKATTQSLPKVEESAYESMMRTTDTLKFTRVANIAGRKSNVASFRCKIDPGSKYICLEALNASGTPVGRNSFALESRIPKDGLVDFVTTAVKSSKLMTCGKRVVVSDKRNGKIYLDTKKL